MIKVQSTVYPATCDYQFAQRRKAGMNLSYSEIISYWNSNGRFNDSLYKRFAQIKATCEPMLIK